MSLQAAILVCSFMCLLKLSLNVFVLCCLFMCLLMSLIICLIMPFKFVPSCVYFCSCFMLSLHVSCAVHKPYEGGTQRQVPGANIVSIYKRHCLTCMSKYFSVLNFQSANIFVFFKQKDLKNIYCFGSSKNS